MGKVSLTGRKSGIFAALLLAALLFLSFNIFSTRVFHNTRIDLTENKLYTLSTGTVNILHDLADPIKLTVYYSKSLAVGQVALQNYAQQINELLAEYQRYAPEQLHITYIDPEPFSEQEDLAIADGVQGIALDEHGTNFYFGLVGSNSRDTVKTLPYFDRSRQNYLEYDLTQMIYQLAHPKKPSIGVITSLPMAGNQMAALYGGNSGQWKIWQQIEENFTVKTLSASDLLIPKDISLLMLAAPTGLTETSIQSISNYVEHGGHLLAFLDNYSETAEQAVVPKKDIALINQLLHRWGVHFVSDKVIADTQTSKQVWFNNKGRRVTIEYPFWQDIPKARLNKDDLITADLDTLTIATPGYFDIEQANTDITKLLTSSAEATAFTPEDVSRYRNDPSEILRQYHADDKTYTYGLRISSFQDNSGSRTIKQPIHVVLFADADMLKDDFWLRSQKLFGQEFSIPVSSNAALTLNSLDNLSGSSDLIAVRSRASYTRPFTKLREIQQQAEQSFRKKEEALLAKLDATEDRLDKLNDHKVDGNRLLLSAAQQIEIEKFRQEQVDIRKELRHVRHELQKDIETLINRVKLVNIATMPICVGMIGFGFGFLRRRKYMTARKRSRI